MISQIVINLTVQWWKGFVEIYSHVHVCIIIVYMLIHGSHIVIPCGYIYNSFGINNGK